jgi:hypothetical protein
VERHLALLAVLAAVWGALAALVGVSLLLLAAGAFSQGLVPTGPALGVAAGLTAAAVAIFGLIAVTWGAAHLWVSAMLRRHRPVGRLLMLGLAGVDLLVLPFGTALGAYAFWVLLTHGGDRLFTVGRKG